ncbi:MAG: methyl-accepting chemotaxis protein, partial [Acutalibacter sp.]|nr:methyl-accepting chemotaxis protein [Acutalibacter sp.]
VNEGNGTVAKVTEALERTNALAGNVTTQMDIVVKAVENQTESITQVTEGIDQISSVVQTNSATSEESAAASQQLSAEASSLKQLVEQFTLAKE